MTTSHKTRSKSLSKAGGAVHVWGESVTADKNTQPRLLCRFSHPLIFLHFCLQVYDFLGLPRISRCTNHANHASLGLFSLYLNILGVCALALYIRANKTK